MSFLEKLRTRITQWMTGRNGPDQLSLAMLILCLVLQVLGALTGSGLFMLLDTVLLCVILFRMFSKNLEKRRQENLKLMTAVFRLRTQFQQRKLRFQRRKEYKYFHCPKCHALIRMKRGEGDKEIHCPKCQHTFHQKA